MSLLRNTLVQFLSWAAVVGCALWAYFEPGFEPVIGVIIGVGGVLTNLDSFLAFRQRRKLTPERKIELRDKWRPIFEAYFAQAARDKYRTDVIVHDVARLDEYPDVKENETRISSWFRVGFMGTYQRGVLLGLRWTYMKEEAEGQWKEYASGPPSQAIKVMLLAEVPYELIESFNPDGDKFYNKPHLFLHFDYGGEPYERLFYGEQRQVFDDAPAYFSEVAVWKRPSWKERMKMRWLRASKVAR